MPFLYFPFDLFCFLHEHSSLVKHEAGEWQKTYLFPSQPSCSPVPTSILDTTLPPRALECQAQVVHVLEVATFNPLSYLSTCHICPRAFIEISPCFSSYCNVSSVGQADLFRKWSGFHRRKSCHVLLETSIMLISQELTKLPPFLFHPGHHSLCRSMLIGLKIWSRWAFSISMKQSNTRRKTSLVCVGREEADLPWWFNLVLNRSQKGRYIVRNVRKVTLFQPIPPGMERGV